MIAVAGGIADVLPAAFGVLGLPGEPRFDLAARVGSPRRLVVLLVDGLGHRLLPRAASAAPFLADVLAGRVGSLDELTCTVPSTTPTSLVSLGTGTMPGEHGILGFTVNIPGTDRVLTHILWRDDPAPAQWAPVPTLYAAAAAAQITSATVLPAIFEGSGLTHAAYGGARFVGLRSGDDQVEAILHTLDTARLVFGYVSAVDTSAHRYGVASQEWSAACAATGELLERLVERLPGDTALLVTADHGGIDVPPSARLDLGTDVRLAAGVRVVAGEPRLRYLHVEPGAAGDVLATWREVLAGRAQVMTREEAVASGMFGPVRARYLARIGDVVAVATGDTAILASGYEPPEVAQLIGFHGAATPAETAIPLMTFGPLLG